jgi:predicted  nucleic acid-binding Zn-ribbon protein
MKKVLLSLLAVAALVLSCQNYDDEFAALNTKIASLESQITSLAELRTAVTGVQSSISSLQSAVAAAQAAAEAAGDAAEAAGDANAAAAASNAQAIAALATSISAIAADLVDLQTAIDGATTEADLDALKSELSTTLAALQALIETNSASISSLIVSNTELKDALEELGVDVDSVLAANATFEGNLTITNSAELAYAKSLGNKVATIKGDVYVRVDESAHTSGGTGEGLTAADVSSIVSQITYVVGNIKIDSDRSLDFSKLASVSGDYIVLNHDVEDDNLLSVGDDVLFNYDGPYVSNIQTADNIYLVIKPIFAGSSTSAPEVGTTSIDFTALTKATGVQSVTSTIAGNHTSGGSISFGSTLEDDKTITVAGNSTTSAATNTNATTSIKIGQAPVVSVVGGNRLTSVELHYAANRGSSTLGLDPNGVLALSSLTVTGTSLTSVKVMAAQITGSVDINTKLLPTSTAVAVVDFPNLITAANGDNADRFTSDALDHNMAKITKIGSLELDEDLTVSLPELTHVYGAITLAKATSLSLPKLTRVGPALADGEVESEINAADITADLVSGSISFPLLTKAGDIDMDAVTSFSAPLAKVTKIDIEEATVSGTTITLPVSVELAAVSTYAVEASIALTTATAFPNDDAITSLKLNAQDANIDLANFTMARTINVTGKAKQNGTPFVTSVSITTANAPLTTLTLGGVLGTVSVDTGGSASGARRTDASTGANDNTALTTITTSGTIESLTVANNYDLTTINALHTDSTTSSLGSVLDVTDNYNLTTLKTGITTTNSINIRNNYKLSNLDLSSVVNIPANFVGGGAVPLNIFILGNFFDTASTGGNGKVAVYGGTVATASATDPLSTYTGLKGSYTAGSVSTTESFNQSGLATLSTLFDNMRARFLGTGATSANSVGILVDVNYAWETSANVVERFTSGETRDGALSMTGTSDSLVPNGTTGYTNGDEVFVNLRRIQ